MKTFKITGTVNGIKSSPVEIKSETKFGAIINFLDGELNLRLADHQHDNAVRKLRNSDNPINSIIECDEVLM